MEKSPYTLMLGYALRLLGGKSYTESELHVRLTRRAKKVKFEAIDGLVARVLARLRELNYVNDERLIENYFAYSLPAKPMGRYGFVSKMQRRGIKREVAEQAWSGHRVDERELARELVERKSRLLKRYPIQTRKKKLAQLLASRGFSPDVVWGMFDVL